MDDLERFEEAVLRAEAQDRAIRVIERTRRNEIRRAAKRHAPTLGDLIAPGVEFAIRLVFADPTIIFSA